MLLLESISGRTASAEHTIVTPTNEPIAAGKQQLTGREHLKLGHEEGIDSPTAHAGAPQAVVPELTSSLAEREAELTQLRAEAELFKASATEAAGLAHGKLSQLEVKLCDLQQELQGATSDRARLLCEVGAKRKEASRSSERVLELESAMLELRKCTTQEAAAAAQQNQQLELECEQLHEVSADLIERVSQFEETLSAANSEQNIGALDLVAIGDSMIEAARTELEEAKLEISAANAEADALRFSYRCAKRSYK